MTGGRGRRPGAGDTRSLILAAARDAFAEHGFEAATLRDIGQRAGVDPAMIHHWFGTKEKLFQAVVNAPVDPQEVLAAGLPDDPERLGEHLVRTLLTVWDSPQGSAALVVVRSSMRSSRGAALLREFVLARVIRTAVAPLGLTEDEALWRGNLVATQLAGLVMVRYVLAVEPLASTAPDDVVAVLAPQVQHYLTGELALTGGPPRSPSGATPRTPRPTPRSSG
ncbi:TetR family transcriptional regulator [Cellulosimicrobium arenosum]|uniref:TetR family transcriptional regulator n=1 Tax=Cellulosimicrobium arenosum TaxID=2708133 RepID=A0A927IZJ0_9MICO|nr:TetR family transcriptional regulator [Cellulosimicrobium arenosum]MBD8079431.1 TetR family transcriptional regulator [Cellulosimicrobium arenosum]